MYNPIIIIRNNLIKITRGITHTGKKRYAVFIIVLAIGLSSSIHAQDSDPLLNRNAGLLQVETPNVASFNKYIENPISPYSGTPDVSIPIYHLTDGSITIPLELRYNTSGIKVEEEASWVGLGWNLNAGGVISRSAIGGVDGLNSYPGSEKYFSDVISAINKVPYTGNYITGGWGEGTAAAFDWYLREPKFRHVQDEGRYNPDVFNFSYPGGSGKFFIDNRDLTLHILNRETNLKIEMILSTGSYSGVVVAANDSRLVGFKVTTPEGVIHQFDYFSTISVGSYPAEVAEYFLLTKTSYPNKQTVNYTYERAALIKYNYREAVYSTIPDTWGKGYTFNGLSYDMKEDPGYGHYDVSIAQIYGSEYYLKEIKTTNYNVAFDLSQREDVPNGMQLNNIQISTLDNTLNKSFLFEYDYFEGSTKGEYWSKNAHTNIDVNCFKKRLKLLSFTEVLPGNKRIHTYKFTYDETDLPRKDSYAVDYWGYSNGEVNNKTMIPDLRNLLWNIYNSSFFVNVSKIKVWGDMQKSQKAYSFKHCTAAILKGIEYPTGGFTEFVYEPNSFVEYCIPTIEQLKSTVPYFNHYIYDDNTFFTPSETYPSAKAKFFKMEKATEALITVTIRKGDNDSWKDIAEHKAYITYGTSSVDLSLANECYDRHIKETVHNQPQEKTLTISKNVILKKSSGYYVVDLPDKLGPQASGASRISMNISYVKPEYEAKVVNQGAGVRIKEINHYESPGKTQLLTAKHYEYTNPDTGLSSGILHDKLQFYNQYPRSFDVLHYPDVFDSHFYFSCDQIEISGNNLMGNPYSNVPDVGYTYVKIKSISNGKTEGYTIHHYLNKEPRTSERSVRLDDPLNGKLNQITYCKEDSTVVRKETMHYDATVKHRYYGLNFNDRINLFPQKYKHSSVKMSEMSDVVHGTIPEQHRFNDSAFAAGVMAPGERLFMVIHPLMAHDITMKSKEIYQDGIVTNESYTYSNNFLQLKTKTLQTSSNENIKHAYTYPTDYDFGVYREMKSANMTSNVIEERIYVNEKYLGGHLTEYDKKVENNNIIAPYRLLFSEIKQAVDNDLVYHDGTTINREAYPSENVSYDKYDMYGNVVSITKNRSEKITYLWSYRGQYLVAKIHNADYAEVEAAVKTVFSVSNINDFASIASPNGAKLKDGSLQAALPNALVTTYTYLPLTGMQSSTDPQGLTTYYEYDESGRLMQTFFYQNGKKQIVENYKYQYRK